MRTTLGLLLLTVVGVSSAVAVRVVSQDLVLGVCAGFLAALISFSIAIRIGDLKRDVADLDTREDRRRRPA